MPRPFYIIISGYQSYNNLEIFDVIANAIERMSIFLRANKTNFDKVTITWLLDKFILSILNNPGRANKLFKGRKRHNSQCRKHNFRPYLFFNVEQKF